MNLKDPIERFNRDESGAIAIFLLAAACILSLLTFVIYDTGTIAKDKMEVQAAADTAAISQASIKARSMNMLAYSNIAKRSIFAINAAYLSNLVAYAEWTAFFQGLGGALEMFDAGEEVRNMSRGSAMIWKNEMIQDFNRYSGRGFKLRSSLKKQAGGSVDPWNLRPDRAAFTKEFLKGLWVLFKKWVLEGKSLATALGKFFDVILYNVRNKWTVNLEDLISGSFDMALEDWDGLANSRFGKDIRAIDNYQRYMTAITPWWAWSEQIVKAMRNGASTSGSSPQPRVLGLPSTSELARAVSGMVDGIRIRLDNTRIRDELPVRPGVGPLSKQDSAMPTDWTTIDKKGPGPALERGHPDHVNRNYMLGKLREQLPAGDIGVPSIIEYVEDKVQGQVDADQFAKIRNDGTLDGGITALLDTDSDGDVMGNAWTIIESMLNSLLMSFPEEWGGKTKYGGSASFFYRAGMTLLTTMRTFSLLNEKNKSGQVGALELTQKIMTKKVGPYAPNPWTIQHYRYESDWLAHTSNIILTYKRDEFGRFDEQRQKYDFVEGETKFGGGQMGWMGGMIGSSIYRSTGYWGMARSEMLYELQNKDDEHLKPDLWRPAWTAKLRPITYPNEFSEGEYHMSSIYHDVLPSMALTSLLGVRTLDDLGNSAVDFFQMERNARAMGWSTMNGVPK